MQRTCQYTELSMQMPTRLPSSSSCTKSLLLQYELNYKPFNIWNIDETGLPDIPREQKVVRVTGEAASQTVAGEKPVNTILLMYVSASSLAMPPMVIFKGPGPRSSLPRETTKTHIFLL